MKKVFLMLAACALTFAATAQTAEQKQQMQREWLQLVKNRNHVSAPYKDQVQKGVMAADTKGGTAKYRGGMPDNFWFPGEWEEVQAVCVTPYYSYVSTNSQYQSMYYACDPIVEGYAAIYQYTLQGWQYVGLTGYTSVIDTSNEDFSKVFFYLMDAIQEGGAQAWVRVENAEDSNAVKTHLATMGLRHDNMRFLVAHGNSFWFRDCGPICFYYGDNDSVAMLDFEYYPGRALDDSLPVHIERQFGLPNFITSIEWEGGNCLVDGTGMLLSSDHIYEANADEDGQYFMRNGQIYMTEKAPLSRAAVRDSMERLIGTRSTYILPAFQHDGGTGHVDLYADMLDENTFVFSKMPSQYSSWNDYRTGIRNMDSLCSYRNYFNKKYKANYIPFPKRDNGTNFASESEYESYTRTYSNHTFVNNLIIQPCFSTVGSDGMPTSAWDRANIEDLKKAYPGYRIYCVNVAEFDGTGGAIHCVTKQIPAESPIRILHPSITGNVGDRFNNSNADIMAIVTNNKGIASVTAHYRIDGGEWQTVNMTAGSNNNYTGTLAVSGTSITDSSVVEYYLSATNNEGKTITKPMTANQGGYFTFVMKNEPDPYAGINMALSAEERFGQFYPNPASAKADMQIDLLKGASYEVHIFDNSGRAVHTSSLQASGSIIYTIDASRLSAGQYTVVFANDSERVVRKLIVK